MDPSANRITRRRRLYPTVVTQHSGFIRPGRCKEVAKGDVAASARAVRRLTRGVIGPLRVYQVHKRFHILVRVHSAALCSLGSGTDRDGGLLKV